MNANNEPLATEWETEIAISGCDGLLWNLREGVPRAGRIFPGQGGYFRVEIPIPALWKAAGKGG